MKIDRRPGDGRLIPAPGIRAGRRATLPLAPLALLLAALLLAACGSSSHTTATAKAATVGTAPCEQIAAVLSDGPDPGADPVGSAQAQILPLRELKLGNAKLEAAVLALSAAYQKFVTTNGATAGKAAVAQASKAVDAICPGATS